MVTFSRGQSLHMAIFFLVDKCILPDGFFREVLKAWRSGDRKRLWIESISQESVLF